MKVFFMTLSTQFSFCLWFPFSWLFMVLTIRFSDQWELVLKKTNPGHPDGSVDKGLLPGLMT